MARIITADEVRELFAQAISAMYQQEVPQYGALLELVADVNLAVLERNSTLHEQLVNSDELSRLNVERHGAIRVGTWQELALLRRIFAVMGMFPVGYYDLSVAGVPAHATAFRPVDELALRRNPFRVFTALLRPELITDTAVRRRVTDLLASRDIFSHRCRALLEQHDATGGFDHDQARAFIAEILGLFSWQRRAQVGHSAWQALSQYHPLLADVVCFHGCHITHLAPRTLDIDRVQALMPEYGLEPRAIIEGPPRRILPLLIRQTGFRAPREPVLFGDQAGVRRARFGAVEQRGMALTPKGRALYDALLQEAGSATDNVSHQLRLQQVFTRFPDTAELLQQQQLAYFRYRLTPQGESNRRTILCTDDPQMLIRRGWLEARPIIYEDFLPLSAAANICASLGIESYTLSAGQSSQNSFEYALGCPVYNEYTLYQREEDRSKQRCGLL